MKIEKALEMTGLSSHDAKKLAEDLHNIATKGTAQEFKEKVEEIGSVGLVLINAHTSFIGQAIAHNNIEVVEYIMENTFVWRHHQDEYIKQAVSYGSLEMVSALAKNRPEKLEVALKEVRLTSG